MPINPPSPSQAASYTALNLCVDAMIEIGMLSPGEQNNVDPDTAQWVLRKANYLLDDWAAQERFVYSKAFQLFTLVPNLSPHTIGPGDGQTPATITVAQRPVRIESAAIVLQNGTAVDIPIGVEDDDWWAANRVKGLASTLPTHLYYSPDLLNGSLYFWPVPTVANGVRLELWNLLSQYAAIDDPIDGPGGNGVLPPAYRNALMLSLAESLLSGASKEDPLLEKRAAKARASITGNNALAPRIATHDAGMPKSDSHTRFNFLTGQPW